MERLLGSKLLLPPLPASTPLLLPTSVDAERSISILVAIFISCAGGFISSGSRYFGGGWLEGPRAGKRIASSPSCAARNAARENVSRASPSPTSSGLRTRQPCGSRLSQEVAGIPLMVTPVTLHCRQWRRTCFLGFGLIGRTQSLETPRTAADRVGAWGRSISTSMRVHRSSKSAAEAIASQALLPQGDHTPGRARPNLVEDRLLREENSPLSGRVICEEKNVSQQTKYFKELIYAMLTLHIPKSCSNRS